MELKVNISTCFFKFEKVAETAPLYIITTVYLFGIIVNFVNIFIFFYLKRIRRRIINQFHSGFLIGNSLIILTLLTLAISNIIGGKFSCFRNAVVFVFYMFGNSVSVSFLVAFTKLQLMVLTNIQRVVTVEDQRKWGKRSFILFGTIILPSILLTAATVAFMKKHIFAVIKLYHIVLNAIAIYYSYRCQKTPIRTNNVERSGNCTDNSILHNAKKDSKIINNAVISTSISNGITAVVYLLLYLRLKTNFREIIFWIGRLHTIPLIMESIIYLAFLIKKAPNTRVKPILPIRETPISMRTVPVTQSRAMSPEPLN